MMRHWRSSVLDLWATVLPCVRPARAEMGGFLHAGKSVKVSYGVLNRAFRGLFHDAGSGVPPFPRHIAVGDIKS